MLTKYEIEHRHDLDCITTYEDNFIGYLDKLEDDFLFIAWLLMAIILDLCLWPLELFYYFYKKRK